VLILPLHRPLTAATFPYATALLIAINILVFFGFQADDGRKQEEAARYYVDVDLGRYEGPVYAQWRKTHPDSPEVDLPPGMPAEIALLVRIQQDRAFLEALRAEQVITAAHEDYEAWRPLRREFDRRWEDNFTERHMARFTEFSLQRMFSAMFLHGDFGHLLGNMVFLAFVGLLVEGALGSRQFLLLYLLGGMGSELASLAYRWGEAGGALGASGAIAALMGAFCVLYGKRKVRFFWWFFVVFDYVRAPALWLLPVWLGWELFNLMFSDAHVGFDAHAGGLVSGALLGWLAVGLGRERREFLDADSEETLAVEEGVANAFPRALGHLAKLEIAPAAKLLAPLAAAPNAPLPVRVAWYRCCRYDAATGDVHAAALRVLQAPLAPGDRVERTRVLEDYLKHTGGVAGFATAEGVALVRAWIEADALDEAERLLPALADGDGLADAWVALARRLHERRELVRANQACAEVVRRWPGTPAAGKATFLQSV
jgi:membrane associated rhomboid family serine protease